MIADRRLWVDTAVARRLGLTERMGDVLCGVASGMTNRDIARALFLAENTSKMHVARMMARLGARDRAHAVCLGYESGLLRTAGEREALRAAAAVAA